MSDLISRHAAIDYVDDVPYIKDHPIIGLLWKTWLEQLPSAEPRLILHSACTEVAQDTISRKAAIEALRKALYDYEDKEEKQFQASDDLDIGDWIEHRIFVQAMSDIDRHVIAQLPPAGHPERKTGSPIVDEDGNMSCPFCGSSECWGNYCMNCGAKMGG